MYETGGKQETSEGEGECGRETEILQITIIIISFFK